jgi:hypothetical protein
MSLSSVRSETALRNRLFSSSRSFRLQPTELLTPPIIRHLAHADLADCVHHVLALRDQNIDLPQLATISSGLYSFLAITVLLDVKDIPQVGPLQWGWITSNMRFCHMNGRSDRVIASNR